MIVRSGLRARHGLAFRAMRGPRSTRKQKYEAFAGHVGLADRFERLRRPVHDARDARGVRGRGAAAAHARRRGGARPRPGEARPDPGGSGGGDHRQGRRLALRSGRDRQGHRAGRLPHRAAGQGSEPRVRGRCRSLRALGRHHPGHHRHRARAAAARRPRADPEGSDGHRGGARGSGAPLPGHPDGRAHPCPACTADHLRLQVRAVARPRCSAIPRASPGSAARSPWCSSVARWARSPRSARTASA